MTRGAGDGGQTDTLTGDAILRVLQASFTAAPVAARRVDALATVAHVVGLLTLINIDAAAAIAKQLVPGSRGIERRAVFVRVHIAQQVVPGRASGG